jgi:hypothetical protein
MGCDHRYEPRYDEEPNPIAVGMKTSWVDAPALPELRTLLVLRKYVGDVCTKCGNWCQRQR